MKSINSQRNREIKIFCKESDFSKYILSKCKSFQKAFIPPIGMTSAFMQTLISTFIGRRKKIKSEIVHLGVGDGHEGISLPKCLIENGEEKYKKSIIFILPGLTGKIDDPYINSMVSEFIDNGFSHIYVYNYRLLSDRLKIREENINLVDDLQYTFQFLKKQFPEQKIYAVGHSYGANQIVNYLGTFGEQSLVEGAVSIANPYNMQICSDKIRGTIWDFLIARILANKLRQVSHVFEEALHIKPFQIEAALSCKRIYDFDQALTIKIYHFDTVEEYYKEYSSSQRVQSVKRPLLGVSAVDDPVAHSEALPIKDFIDNPNCILLTTSHGGHVGWVEQYSFFKLSHWQVKPAVEFIRAIIG